ncbi:unnamed protein product [marine sediment metagenome]|uniref:Uncharacterized protein n=1 Tax=marine sediment metagenome TaxID=412755 RepID=X1U7D9_9ZZZZ
MKIGLYNLVSEVHNEGYINQTLKGFITEVEEKLGEKFEDVSLKNFNQKDWFPLIFIKSGGAEGKFEKIFKQGQILSVLVQINFWEVLREELFAAKKFI